MTHHSIWRLIVLLIMIACTNCAGLAGEPQIIATFPPVTPDVEYPVSAPDLALGARVYADRCVQCHGVEGGGDGTLIGNAPNQIANVPLSFLESINAADKTPLEWYQVITNGRIDKLMPPWKDALTDEERWAVAFYIYSLHYSEGAASRGDEIVSAYKAVTFTLPSIAEMVKLTDSELVETAGLSLPEIADNQRQYIAAYLRNRFTLNSNFVDEAGGQSGTTDSTPLASERGNGVVSGQVVNGTADGIVPKDIIVELYTIDQNGTRIIAEATINVDGRYQISNVNLQSMQNYVVTAKYKGHIFSSELKTGDPDLNTLDLPINIYELTDDIAVIKIAGWVWRVRVDENIAYITQVIRIINDSDRAFTSENIINNGQYETIKIDIPPNADIQTNDMSNRYLISDDERTVIDTVSVLPEKDHIIQIAYRMLLPDAAQIEQSTNYTFDGPARLLIEQNKVEVSSDQLLPLGTEVLDNSTYTSYGANIELNPEDSIYFKLRNLTPGSSTIDENRLRPLLLITSGAIIVIITGLLYRKSMHIPQTDLTLGGQNMLINGLIRQIAELDHQWTDGKISEAMYHQRRNRLKVRLITLINRDIQ